MRKVTRSVLREGEEEEEEEEEEEVGYFLSF